MSSKKLDQLARERRLRRYGVNVDTSFSATLGKAGQLVVCGFTQAEELLAAALSAERESINPVTATGTAATANMSIVSNGE